METIESLKLENLQLERDRVNAISFAQTLQDEIDVLENTNFILEGVNANNRTQMAMEELFDNLDYIPIAEIENFINTHKKI